MFFSIFSRSFFLLALFRFLLLFFFCPVRGSLAPRPSCHYDAMTSCRFDVKFSFSLSFICINQKLFVILQRKIVR